MVVQTQFTQRRGTSYEHHPTSPQVQCVIESVLPALPHWKPALPNCKQKAFIRSRPLHKQSETRHSEVPAVHLKCEKYAMEQLGEKINKYYF